MSISSTYPANANNPHQRSLITHLDRPWPTSWTPHDAPHLGALWGGAIPAITARWLRSTPAPATPLCGFCLERPGVAKGRQATICRPCAVQVMRALVGG